MVGRVKWGKLENMRWRRDSVASTVDCLPACPSICPPTGDSPNSESLELAVDVAQFDLYVGSWAAG